MLVGSSLAASLATHAVHTVQGSDHMASNMMAMGMYGDHGGFIPFHSTAVVTFSPTEIDTTPGAPMRRLNLSRNYAEDLQRQREIEELAQALPILCQNCHHD